MWNSFKTWLRAAPIADDVDRRNAPIMQLLLVLYGLGLPAAWAWHLSSRPIPPGWGVVMVLDMSTSLLALGCCWMVRKGRFRPAMMIFLGSLMASLALAHYKLGTQSQLIDQSSMILTLVIGGLVLGRRALWTVYAMLLVVFAIGFTVDATNPARSAQWVRNALKNAPTLAGSYFIITLVLDRTITALRESLEQSLTRGRELQLEMQRRERAQSQLIHAQKMEASGRLASGVAHDFSNVLGVIQGFAAQRHHAVGNDRERVLAMDDALEGIDEAAARGLALTRKLLGFARNDVLHIEPFDAGHALIGLRPMLRQLFGAGVQLELCDAGDPLPVRLDRNEFELMVLNIAANARDAMPAGGVFRVGATQAGDGVAITLADNGHGMDAHTRQRIFEPFFSTKSAAAGTGLGLAVVHDLVHAVGGDIDVDSEPGRGTVFTIRLPHACAMEAVATA